MVFGLFSGATKTIAVMGATGLQGGAVVKAFKELNDDDITIRAITRDPTSEKALAIESMVDEIVQANGDDEDSMVKAFDGCYGAFIVSNFWEDLDVRHEMQTLRTIKEAAKKAGVKHVVLSTLDDSRHFVNEADNKNTWKVLDEELGMYVPHFDGKGEVGEEYAAELPATLLYTTLYYESFINYSMGPSRQNDSDPYAITFPMADKKLSMVAVEDIGKAACAILQDDSYIGKTVGVQSEALTCEDIAALFAKICGQPVQYNAVPTEVYASFGFPGADDLANMMRYYAENEEAFLSRRELGDLEEKMGGVVSLEDWITKNKDAFVLEETKPAAPKPAIVKDTGCNCAIM